MSGGSSSLAFAAGNDDSCGMRTVVDFLSAPSSGIAHRTGI